MKCLEKKPEARYRSMEELIHEVETIVQFAGERVENRSPSRELKSDRGRWHWPTSSSRRRA